MNIVMNIHHSFYPSIHPSIHPWLVACLEETGLGGGVRQGDDAIVLVCKHSKCSLDQVQRTGLELRH